MGQGISAATASPPAANGRRRLELEIDEAQRGAFAHLEHADRAQQRDTDRGGPARPEPHGKLVAGNFEQSYGAGDRDRHQSACRPQRPEPCLSGQSANMLDAVRRSGERNRTNSSTTKLIVIAQAANGGSGGP